MAGGVPHGGWGGWRAVGRREQEGSAVVRERRRDHGGPTGGGSGAGMRAQHREEGAPGGGDRHRGLVRRQELKPIESRGAI